MPAPPSPPPHTPCVTLPLTRAPSCAPAQLNFYCGYFVKAPDANSSSLFPYNITYKVRACTPRDGFLPSGSQSGALSAQPVPPPPMCRAGAHAAAYHSQPHALRGGAGEPFKTPAPPGPPPGPLPALAPQDSKGNLVGEPSASVWLFRTPDALRLTLDWLNKRYSVGGRTVE
jgi:hypothetical protein